MMNGKGKAALILAFVAFAFLSIVSARSGADAERKSTAGSSVSSPLPSVKYYPKSEVEATFNHERESETLYDSDYGSKSYKVKASRRIKTTAAETHSVWTDVIYVTKGSATLVTGGKLAGKDETPATFPDGTPYLETKMATRIEGGESRRVSVGDVVVIPAGTPHWFTEIEGPFWFFNVKTR
jgi:glc operon protein GlcG